MGILGLRLCQPQTSPEPSQYYSFSSYFPFCFFFILSPFPFLLSYILFSYLTNSVKCKWFKCFFFIFSSYPRSFPFSYILFLKGQISSCLEYDTGFHLWRWYFMIRVVPFACYCHIIVRKWWNITYAAKLFPFNNCKIQKVVFDIWLTYIAPHCGWLTLVT